MGTIPPRNYCAAGKGSRPIPCRGKKLVDLSRWGSGGGYLLCWLACPPSSFCCFFLGYRECSFEHAGLADVATSAAAAADQRRLSHFLATNKSTFERVENEVFDRRPDRSAISHCASEILRGRVTKAVFCFGRKVTGDVHVPSKPSQLSHDRRLCRH